MQVWENGDVLARENARHMSHQNETDEGVVVSS